MLKQILFSIAIACAAIYAYYNKNLLLSVINVYMSVPSSNDGERLFRKEELKKYNGVDKPELYIGLLGNVFDVTKGAKFYGPGEGYHAFVGQDLVWFMVSGEGFLGGCMVDKLTNR